MIGRITPEVLRPGGQLVVEGQRLTARGQRPSSVTVDGIPVPLMSATTGRLEGRLPERGFRCAPQTAVWVAIQVGDSLDYTEHPLEVASQVQLETGEGRRLNGASDHCLELVGASSYLVPVVNAFPHPDSLLAVLFRTTGSAATERSPVTDTTILAVEPAAAGTPPVQFESLRSEALAHALTLERNQEVIAIQSSEARAPLGRSRSPADPVSGRRRDLRRNDVLPLRFALDTNCRDFDSIQSRAVYVSRKVAVLEDVAAPLGGQVDSLLEALGREYDNVIHPMLLDYFGDPTAFDGYLDGDGRLLVLITPRVSGRLGLINACDFYDQTQDPASNQGEIVYIRSLAPEDVIERWWRETRTTVTHEAAHVAAYAGRFRNRLDHPFDMLEDSWLMEALAMQAEEIFARRFSGARWKGNANFDESLACYFWPEKPDCQARPQGVGSHFDFIWDFYLQPETRSPLRDLDQSAEDIAPENCMADEPYRRSGAPFTADLSFFGSGWSLLRWAADHFGGDEKAFFRKLTQEHCLSSTRNLEIQTGRRFADLVVDWLVATALDDRPGFTPRDPLHTIPSWNTYEILSRLTPEGMFPLRVTRVDARPFEEPFVVRGASARFFEIEVPSGMRRIVEIRAGSGPLAGGFLHVPVVRTQ
ncbi:MAG TPA: hypothetical protein VGR37_12485 [Longimicrobiaceae bacterium]|nr:hypothetical protein [Longimicrobiaceae bacterium]